MTAQTSNQGRVYRDGKVIRLPVNAGAKLYTGQVVDVDADGNAINATKGASKRYAGVADGPADNSSGADGAAHVDVRRQGVFQFPYEGAAPKYGATVYLEDNNTVTVTATGATALGKALGDQGAADNNVWVELSL